MAGIIPLGVVRENANDILQTSVVDTRYMTGVPTQYGVLLTIKTGGSYSHVQIFFQRGTSGVWYRTAYSNEGYETEWHKVV